MTEPLVARYQRFARQEARGHSPLYEALALGVAADPAVLAFLAALAADKQQPNLLFAAVRLVCGTPGSFADFRDRLLSQTDAVMQVMQSRRTQTNEPGRCAILLAALADLSGPIALIEVGASAGLCLLPDCFGYDYGRRAFPGTPVLRCHVNEACPLPAAMPDIAWRAGLDLEPGDVADPDQVAWLEALVWPDQMERLARLRQAIEVARSDPPRVVRGDLRTDTVNLMNEARGYGRVVVFHSAVLAYLPDQAERLAFVGSVQEAGALWISNEAPIVFPAIADVALSVRASTSGGFLLSRDAIPVAWTDPHGAWIDWFG